MASYSPFDCIIFDLDDTLYSSNIGFGDATKRNIDDFLVEKCGFEPRKASALRVQLFKTYGSTLAGLRALGYDVDADDYHSIVHGRLPYHLIKPDPQLRNLLLTISQRKIIFTNSDRTHAMKALNLLGIEDCFEQIICFETMNPNLFNSKPSSPQEYPVVLKPSLDAINIALDVAEVDPSRTLFLDDNARNIAAGKAVGLKTVLVGKDTKTKEADYALEKIHNLMKVVPEIWFSEKKKVSLNRTPSDLNSTLNPTHVAA
ncbi:haloacid dehalogenase-like hydrolase (HAD) superfamily protein [Artemisia annua]|uniref:Haloacid dehalogenase-like hydrolase (HAD) superfamily protein n=1 Tax=Artemisia annua TaxID=35608 RepID=A0A2U1N6A2_ARTAN|nr:haloacid dehalogenase-like hydrolase (HAD) superfamily protein [Artemisia annua]